MYKDKNIEDNRKLKSILIKERAFTASLKGWRNFFRWKIFDEKKIWSTHNFEVNIFFYFNIFLTFERSVQEHINLLQVSVDVTTSIRSVAPLSLIYVILCNKKEQTKDARVVFS